MISPREVRVMGVSEAKPDNEIYLLMLEEVEGSRKLPIIIGSVLLVKISQNTNVINGLREFNLLY